MKFLKNKKVIAALAALVLAIVGVALGQEVGISGQQVAEIVCQVVTCE